MLSVAPCWSHDDLDDVAADWRAWAEAYRLPDASGGKPTAWHVRSTRRWARSKVARPVAAPQGPPHARPPTAFFLARRKTGKLGAAS